MDVYNTTDDMKATELRKNLPHDKGFPVYLVTVIFNKEIAEKKLFITRKAMEEYISTLPSTMSIEKELLKIQDVKFLSYEVD